MLQDDSDPNRIHLYEVYRDQAALGVHRKAPHYLKWRAKVKDWFDGDVKRVATTTIFPAEATWQKQKPSLIL